ncbi:tripartite tricarboxylate transporter substrate binding protein [Vandammella animalimorsus]|uniref:Tripartite tricarboxylate transporter substrate binding protein n=1 Tax=Vandammella animalimorsus TaxID=2029117 RepID=A0A3M6RUQ6_9BURK|nr:tripartite tricarboxylate transporter substrate binding protein [Vandammella animalimorsus]RMX18942.1 tripartite tricarboxylate transporter substrate binding protein [Vandammella animalimorsus]
MTLPHCNFSRRVVLAAVLLICATGSPSWAQQAWPSQPVRFIVPYAPGGTTDLVARTTSELVAKKIGQPVVVENRPGAGGNIGMEAVAKAQPDGYTIGLGAISTNALNPHIYNKMPFDPRKDFTPISMLGHSTIVLTVAPSVVPAASIQDFLAYVKANPGLSFGTAGSGTSMHLAGVMFSQAVNVEMSHVAYKGSAPGISDMLGGHLPVMFDNLPASLPHVQAGKLRALAVAGKTRSPQLPDVPTLAEAGLKDYAVDPWFGVFGPAGMDSHVVERLSAAFQEALSDPHVKEKLTKAGFSPAGSNPVTLGELTRTEYERLGQAAKAMQLRVD